MDTANRDKAMEIANRAKSDPTYMAQLKSDPEGTLTAAGLPEKAVVEFMVEDGLGEVSGYGITGGGSGGGGEECLCTGCCVTVIVL
ncbi:MAG TPA: hypothetical protein VKY74_01210 [Chloroflexia bacterium]|nr:hypothetical protein [Chloroflexia bacterium]